MLRISTEAIAIAAQIPCAQVGTVEIRPVIEVAGLPLMTALNPKSQGETCDNCKHDATHEAQIRQLIADQQRAIAKMLTGICPYATEVILFDVKPPFKLKESGCP